MMDEQASKALDQLDKKPRDSKKFFAFVLTLVLMVAAGAFAFARDVNPELLEALLFLVGLFATSYIGTTAWQDRAVRMAAVMRGAPPPGPR